MTRPTQVRRAKLPTGRLEVRDDGQERPRAVEEQRLRKGDVDGGGLALLQRGGAEEGAPRGAAPGRGGEAGREGDTAARLMLFAPLLVAPHTLPWLPQRCTRSGSLTSNPACKRQSTSKHTHTCFEILDS